MRKVKDLIAELKKFPEDADCYAYEGEVTGVIIVQGEDCGVIHCTEDDDTDTKETELFDESEIQP